MSRTDRTGARTPAAATPPRPALVVPCLLLLLAGAACRQDMHDAPMYEPLEASEFFEDGRASRPLEAGTVAVGHLDEDDHFHRGRVEGEFARTLPLGVDLLLLERGRERYGIFCSPCHDLTGAGEGMIVRRGFRQPSSLHIERLRAVPPGYLFDVISNGFGAMPDYREQIPVRDRWAIVAYVRALQLSQAAPLADLTAEDRRALEAAGGEARP